MNSRRTNRLFSDKWIDEKTSQRLAAIYVATRILLVGSAVLFWLPVISLFPHELSLSLGMMTVLAGLYIAALTLFCIIFDCFEIGQARIRELAAWYGLATLFTNIFMWLVSYVATYNSISVLIIVIVWITQSFVGTGLIILLNRLYYSVYPIRRICAIVGGYDYEKRTLAKMAEYSHRFVIEKVIKQDQITVEDVRNLAPEYNTLVIGDIDPAISKAIILDSFIKARTTFFIPTVVDVLFKGYKTAQIKDELLFVQKNSGLTIEQRAIKRIVDVVGSIVGIVLSVIPIGICAVIIKATDGGPLFYTQDRLTRDGKVFKLLKLRSMRTDAEKEGVQFATKDDNRITPIGRLMRKTRLDETPQFFNVLLGDMSLCGPRAERPKIAELYEKEVPEFAYRLKVKAGITGYAQINGRYNTVLEDKLRMDLFYIVNWSIVNDLALMLETAKMLFSPDSTAGYDVGEIERLFGNYENAGSVVGIEHNLETVDLERRQN